MSAPSAEQLAIAMMAEARRLYGVAEQRSTSAHDVPAYQLAERLAGWASDVRQLGVELHMAHCDNYKQQWDTSQGKMEKVRLLCEDNIGLRLAQDVLEALGD